MAGSGGSAVAIERRDLVADPHDAGLSWATDRADIVVPDWPPLRLLTADQAGQAFCQRFTVLGLRAPGVGICS